MDLLTFKVKNFKIKVRLFLIILTIPHFIACMILCNNKKIVRDLNTCVDFINKERKSLLMIDDYYYDILVIAEDHRNPLHYGVDPIAIIRCIYLKLTKKIIQGGSTIEQQLVRTLTGRYERTLRRKIREQVIAILLKNKIKSKNEIGKAYLLCAYFGYNKIGFFNLSEIEKKDAIELIARLKYPTKKNEKPCENEKITRRKRHINGILKNKIIFINNGSC
ncbi:MULTISPECIES: transglycosylase domain-containing protein [Yersinia]|uniref:transglycosylase domain-containing protein n=1 Tax=Yersinia TaxID=629 RepID=UPI00155D99A5|nr:MULTISPECIES: transglycosylase domain-containing protein [Yersinia]EKN4029692.1 transglycosylase domain-containing protein [Yersinia enterocolitica]EKN4055081.1 transglycosylase domain-containing protein [Yersinia enterocolitica]ELI8059878.1 transglycosylase domain-containing protein [Yersinia enterocolitica]MBW5876823.1 transglycosylase domain-containing protein [Yersinia enterocolitica]HDL7463530.1 transglycosylase domain-containing protein [Yersinia enterocolitica]